MTGLTAGTHTVYVVLVDGNHNVITSASQNSHQFIIGPMKFVDGNVPNWMQPYYYDGSVMSGHITNNNPLFNNWCVPTAAACQLGHLNSFHSLTLPSKASGHHHGIDDGVDASQLLTNDTGINGTKVWDSEHGWGDSMIDGPIKRYTMGMSHPEYDYTNVFPLPAGKGCETTDFGWYMNTNNSSEVNSTDPRVSGQNVAGNVPIINLSPQGTTVGNAYLGLKDFYRMLGYDNMVGIVYHRISDGTVGSIPVGMPTQPQGIYPRHWLDQNLQNNITNVNGTDYIITGTDLQMMWETIKREIDDNRTVIACTQGWQLCPNLVGTPPIPLCVSGNITPTAHVGDHDSNFPNTTNTYEKSQPIGLTPDGSDYYHLGPESTSHSNPEHLNDGQTLDDSTDPPHWGGTALGHTILIIGYIPRGAADDVSGGSDTDWLIVRDNDDTTARNVIVPYSSANKNQNLVNNAPNVDTTRFLEDMILATIYTDHTHPTILMNLVSCP
jgi:hypothetical protein